MPPLGFRTRPFDDPALDGVTQIVRFTFDPGQHGNRVCLTFAATLPARADLSRILAVASALWRLAQRRPDVVYRDVHVDTSDCGDDRLPESVLRFVRGPAAGHRLLPNAYLLARRKPLPAALPWRSKSDQLFFRGAATGDRSYDRNVRVALCLAAKQIPDSDCGFSTTSDMDVQFDDLCRRDEILAARTPAAAMNQHRLLVDVDGYTSSWDRYLRIGQFGGLPIRFETIWHECWHMHLIEGENIVAATRENLAAVVDSLRSDPRRAEGIAAAAAELTARHLSPQGVQQMFEDAWISHVNAGESRPEIR